MDIKLNSEEAYMIKEILKHLQIRKRTGELGIIHGMDRFVSTQIVFKKAELEHLDRAASKVGLTYGIARSDK